jgi:hypothetical protein
MSPPTTRRKLIEVLDPADRVSKFSAAETEIESAKTVYRQRGPIFFKCSKEQAKKANKVLEREEEEGRKKEEAKSRG